MVGVAALQIFNTTWLRASHCLLCQRNTDRKSVTMEDSINSIPSSERVALQWLIPALDRPLQSMPHDEFLKAWFAIGYLYGGLNPDEATFHGTQVNNEDIGPDRFRLIEPRLVAPF